MLRCISRYQSNGYGPYEAGEVIEHLTPDDIAHLLADSPGSFVVPFAKAVTRALEEPPMDRMVHKARTRKAGAA